MQSAWIDRDAEAAVARYADLGRDLALRVYTTRLLGQDPRLVLHGGGNTSVKTRVADLNGDAVDVLCVKGSGWDMGSIEPAGPARGTSRTACKTSFARKTFRRGDGAAATRQPDRSGGAQSIRRGIAARIHSAQIRRPHPFDGRACAHRPAR